VIDRRRYAPASGLRKGAYILAEASGSAPELILTGTGSEVHLLLQAMEELEREGRRVRVVAFPCWELFEAQPESYKQEVFPPGVPVLAVEAGVSLGWERYTGSHFRIIGMDRFGASAPAKVLFKEFGFTPERLIRKAKDILAGA